MLTNEPFKGKVALVTGGSRGIGKAISLKLASLGADVIINYYRKTTTAVETAEQVRTYGVRAHIIKANIGEPEKLGAMFAEIEEKFGQLDIFVSNAASGTPRPPMDLDQKGWDWTMDINARAFLLCAQHAVPLMPEGGKIVSISSLGSFLVTPSYTSVGVSKAALEALTRYLAVDLAPRGISVNCVSGGAVETDSLKAYAEEAAMRGFSVSDTPAGRTVKPEDIAEVVAFLCSEAAAMIRGQVIIVDGGLSLQL